MWRIRKKHIFFNPNIKRIKSNKKYKKVLEWYVLLYKKEKKEWETKWIINEKNKCNSRLKKYWITEKMVEDYLKTKKI